MENILIQEKVDRTDDFIWQSQMKAYWDTQKDDCHLDVCDASIWYGYEYLGNGDPKKQIKGDDEPYPGYDLLFCFASIWSMGIILTDKDGIDFKRNISDWFRQNFKYKIPPKGTVFDYYVIMDPENPRFEEWTKK